MTVEEARAALAEAEQAVKDAKGKGVSAAVAASKNLSAAKRALATAEKAEAAGINVSDVSRAEQLSAIRQAEYAAAQEEAGKGNKPVVPPSTATEKFDYVWRPEPGGRGGYWSLVSYPIFPSITPIVTDENTDTTGYKVVNGVLQFNGQPFTGTYNGQTYENGIVKSATDTTGYKVVNGVLLFNGQPFNGTYNGQQYQNGKVFVSSDGDTVDKTTADLIKSLQNQIDTLTQKNTTSAADIARADRQSAFEALRIEMAAIGLEALVEPLRGLIEKNVAPSEFTVQLRQSEAYKQRFAANETRRLKGLRVLNPGEYLRVEDAYRQTLRTYGLRQFDNDAYVRQFIENDISAAELSDRVSMAVQRVQNADPAIARTLKDYYGIDQATLVGYVLDPNQQLQKIQRQVAAAEIGTAARLQGIQPGVAVAEQLAAQGITEAEAQKGYSTIADVLPTAEKLSGLYGKSMETYGLAEGEQEVFNTLASAQRKRKNLIGREIAEFSGQSGVGRGSLGTATGGQY